MSLQYLLRMHISSHRSQIWDNNHIWSRISHILWIWKIVKRQK